jgi:hypothetical protein
VKRALRVIRAEVASGLLPIVNEKEGFRHEVDRLDE